MAIRSMSMAASRLRSDMRVVVMGVSGCGKSSIGSALGKRMGLPFFEGDTLHSAASIEKMRSGTPLTDDDRWPWLDRVAETLARAPAIVSCSALKRIYRDRIRSGTGAPVQFVHLTGDRDLIAARVAARCDHYMPPTLLDSQFAALEFPDADEAVTLDITLPSAQIVDRVLHFLKGTQS